ncbi:hypothetical protein JXA88_05125 [Candidatus Fermentibacteria bacterium]|nr:hypothetical protein [Candidatus Fermentibacteria bacterium]
MVGLKYFKSGFYQERCRAITAAVEEYAQARAKPDESRDELAARRSEVERLLARMAVESGLREEEESFLAVDGEFFPESGELDRKRLYSFVRAILYGYALQELKWMFAGTTVCLTPITRRTLAEAGIRYEDLLPLELQRRRRRDLQLRHASTHPNRDTMFVYPDGRMRGIYLPEAARVSYAELEDRSGFDWRSGYSPGRWIRREKWLAGFNERGEWERIDFDRDLPLVRQLPADDLLRFFTDRLEIGAEELYFIAVPFLDEALLFDTRSRLMSEDERRYYSVTGELYAVRTVDRQGSIEAVRSQLKRMGVEKLTGIVAGDDLEATQTYYRRAFADLMTTATRVYSRTDRELGEKLTRLRDEAAARDISRGVVVRFFQLVREGRTAQEVYDGLTPSAVKPEYEVSLRLFANAQDLELFLALPEIDALLDEEAIQLIKSIEVPEGSRDLYSNALQNLLLNFDSVLRGSGISPTEVIRLAHQVLVEGESEEARRISIVGEKPLQDILRAATPRAARVAVPAFRLVTPGPGGYFDVFDGAQFDRWAESAAGMQIPRRYIPAIRQMIVEADIPGARREDYSRGIQRTMTLYREIAQSTNLNPVEILEIFNEIFLEGASRKAAAQAGVYVARSLETLVREASEGNSNRVRRLIRDIYSVLPPGEPTVDLLSELGLQLFRQSAFYRELGISEFESKELLGVLKSIRLPLERSEEFAGAVVRILSEHAEQLRDQGVSISEAVEALASTLAGRERELSPELKRLLYAAIGEPAGPPDAGVPLQLNLFQGKGFQELAAGKEFRELGLEERRFAELLELHRGSYRGAERRYVGRVPLRLRSERGSEDFPLALGLTEGGRRIHDVGWVVDFRAGRPAAIGYTELGWQVIPEDVKQEISRIFRGALGAERPRAMAVPGRLTRTEELLVEPHQKPAAEELLFVPRVSVVQLEAAPEMVKPEELELASPFAALRARLEELRVQAAGPARAVPEASTAKAARPQAEGARAGAVSIRKRRQPIVPAAATTGDTVERHYREDKEKLAEVKKRRASETQARLHREQVQRTADDLFARVVERLESPAHAAQAPEARDELFDRLIERIGGDL